ncbi:helix-turn-helix domain-containing protein [Falsibacillus pallidus]|uniref:Xre family transcriptional regulator n=1 Tax=Falsibacillus pallidus TaxID=493781 RepID=A0A370GQ13_9BACI|nr:helix-turn-helix transcriptional regulator [Falsibacillus pallidus]RDI44053.1 Xre family transcriptional regulator [Falsibacillus pallidus]
MKLGERLKSLRKSAGLTLAQLKDATGLSVSYLSDLERGRTNPSVKTLNKLASIYKISVSSLTEGVEGYGVNNDEELIPESLLALKDDTDIGKHITDEDLYSLNRISLRGKQPQTALEWKEIYLYLKRMLPGDE